jgi:heptosyltransferase II
LGSTEVVIRVFFPLSEDTNRRSRNLLHENTRRILVKLVLRLWHYGSYLLLRLCEDLVGLLPLDGAFIIGKIAGELMYWILAKRRKMALANLRLVFGHEMSETQLRALNRKHFQLLGANFLAGLKASTMPSEKIWERVTANLPEERPRIGWLALISHLSCWELFSHLAEKIPEYRFGAVYRRLYNPYLDQHLRKTRARSGTTLFDRYDDLLKCVRFLRDGGVVGLLIDQRAGRAGVWMPLFGRLASSSTLAATLSIRTGTPVLPIAIETCGRARWKMIISEPVFPPQDGETELFTARINRLLEEMIRRSPADWLWAHNRWKENRPALLFTRDQRRRVFLPPDFDRTKLVPFRILIVSPDTREAATATLPAVRAIQQGRPDAWLAALTPGDCAPIWRDAAEINRVIEFGNESLFTVASNIRRAAAFDAAIFFWPTWKTALAVWQAGIPVRVARRCGPMSFLFNLHPARPKDISDPVRLNLRLAKSIGANIDGLP